MKFSKNTAQHYFWGNNCEAWSLINNENISIKVEKMPPGTCEVEHYHKHATQYFFVLDGILEMHVNNDKIKLNKYEGIIIKPMYKHQVINNSNSQTQFLVISSPTADEDRVVV
jgi:mannose-6-phosphate isomerase-like protein (cupin superfamily)